MKTAKIISAILHPIFLPTYMMLVMVAAGLTRFSPDNDFIFIISTLIMTCLFPGLVVVMMKRWKVISSLEMERRDDRIGPIILMMISLYGAVRLFNNVSVLAMFNFYLYTALIISVLAFIVTFFWKISLHALGWGGVVGCLFILTRLSMSSFLPYFLASIVLSGVVAAARIKEESHSNAQLIAGFAAGFSTPLLLYLFFLLP